ncbi:AAA family ATPase [Chryseomicrobium excrementi]|uniref:AAA family ATPase n=1 Tax=Chryseomicrobium excrementi TaxID=2041346 RepID=A0A2M9F0J3_9BACL|nr:MoxR family ATPase [Chryseomicrobium excrementi]PJK16983.1 AAA family ATPase [Chryseomicrobium excrementi]
MTYTPEQFEDMSNKFAQAKDEISKFIVGQSEAIDYTVLAMVAGGHTLLEGLPGLGKTMLIRTIGQVCDLSFSRIQFTPDLMPADITGTSMIERSDDGKTDFVFKKGPLFHQLVLADEINRATPKTQSALLEAMGEHTVTVLGETRQMEDPFFVLATQNPIEMEGTYPLPEAQVDRFLCKVVLPYPSKQELKEIMMRTTGAEKTELKQVLTTFEIRAAQQMVKHVLLADDLMDYAIDVITATHPETSSVESIKRYVQFGSGPRGLQSLIRIAKARAFLAGRVHVSIADIKQSVKPVLRHRIRLNYEAEATGLTPDLVLDQMVDELAKS